MTVSQAIHERRTIHSFLPDPVALELVNQILEAGLWAPNHKMTQPWRFTVVGPYTRARLADALADTVAGELPADATDDRIAKTRETARSNVFKSPVLVIVTSAMSGNPMQDEEDLAATSVAIQNMQLVAWEQGVGSKWSTGRYINLTETPELLGLAPEEHVVGALLLGYADGVGRTPTRKPLEEVMRVLP